MLSNVKIKIIIKKMGYYSIQIMLNHSNKQHGAVEARWAHNPEGPRSKRGVATTYGIELHVMLFQLFLFQTVLINQIKLEVANIQIFVLCESSTFCQVPVLGSQFSRFIIFRRFQIL